VYIGGRILPVLSLCDYLFKIYFKKDKRKAGKWKKKFGGYFSGFDIWILLKYAVSGC